MKLIAYTRLGGELIEVEVSQLVCLDRFGNPLLVATDQGPKGMEQHHVSKVGDPDFRQALTDLGIDRLVVCQSYKAPSPAKGSVLIAGPSS